MQTVCISNLKAFDNGRASRIVDSFEERRERERKSGRRERRKRKCTEVKRAGLEEIGGRERGGVARSFVRDCRQFPQGLVASGSPNKLFRG